MLSTAYLSARRAARVALLAAALLGAATAAQAAPVTEFSQGLSAGSSLDGLTVGPDDALWFVDAAAGHGGIGRVTPGGHITEFSAGLPAGSQPHAIQTGGDGNLYFTDLGTTKGVGRITPAGSITETPAGTGGLNAGAVPTELAEGPGGTLWFLDAGPTVAIGEIGPTGTITEHPLAMPDPTDTLNEITEGPDGDMYFTIQGDHPGIGRVTPGGTVTRIDTGMLPNDLTAGPDGNLWFDDGQASTVSRLTVATSAVSDFGTASGLQANAQPDAMTGGPDGNVWFTDQLSGANQIGRITPAGAITEFPLVATPWGITPGIDGNLWTLVGGAGINEVARVTPQGTVTYVKDGLAAGADFTESDVIQGPDGNLWAIDKGTPEAIVRADVQLAPTAVTGTASAVTASSATITGTANPRGNAATVVVDYGTTPSLGHTVAAAALPDADASSPIFAALTGLPASSTVFYRVRATNAYGTATGTTLSLTTARGPATGSGGPGTGSGGAGTGSGGSGMGSSSASSVTFGNQRITILTPSRAVCLARTARLPVTVRSVTLAHSRATKLRFRRATLRLDRGVRHRVRLRVSGHRITRIRYRANATLHALPASRSLRLSALKRGRHTLRVRLTYTHTAAHRGRRGSVQASRTLTVGFRVC